MLVALFSNLLPHLYSEKYRWIGGSMDYLLEALKFIERARKALNPDWRGPISKWLAGVCLKRSRNRARFPASSRDFKGMEIDWLDEDDHLSECIR